MLLEIIWLTFAIAWGTIKVWTTRAVAQFNFDGSEFTANQGVSQENSWSFGQTLPLVLILLPLLSMAQAYLDNDAKAQKALEQAETAQITVPGEKHDSAHATEFSGAQMTSKENDLPNRRRSTFCSIASCNHSSSIHPAPASNTTDTGNADTVLSSIESETTTPMVQHKRLVLPQYPYAKFTSYSWYQDTILLLLCQILMLTGFSLWVLTELANVMGISAILRNRLFVIWVFGMVPFTSLAHLAMWYVAGHVVVRWPGGQKWLKGEGKDKSRMGGNEKWWRRCTTGQVVYWCLRMGLVAGCLIFTLFGSLEAASPYPLDESV